MNQRAPLDLPEFAKGLAGKFDIVPIELRDCPVFLASAMPRHPGVMGHSIRIPAGRGLSSRDALISAAAESIELLHSLARVAGRPRLAVSRQGGLAHLQVASLTGGAAVMVPAQHLYLDWAVEFGETPIYEADSSGCAAGTSFPDAADRALLECVERDACAAWWYGRQSRRHLALTVLRGAAPRLMWWLESRYRRTLLIDISSDIDLPVIAAASAEPDGRFVAIGTAAAWTVQQAAISAVTEMVQTEVALKAGRSPGNLELEEWIGTASLARMPQFKERRVPGEAPASREKSSLALHVAAKGFDVLAYQFVPDSPGLTTVRCLVPGFSAMHRRYNSKRILQLTRDQPDCGGARSREEFETLELY